MFYKRLFLSIVMSTFIGIIVYLLTYSYVSTILRERALKKEKEYKNRIIEDILKQYPEDFDILAFSFSNMIAKEDEDENKITGYDVEVYIDVWDIENHADIYRKDVYRIDKWACFITDIEIDCDYISSINLERKNDR